MSKSKIFSLPVRVYFHDTDAGGVVYHASYLNFMERARTEWLRTHGYSNAGLIKDIGRSRISLLQTVRRGAEVLTEAEVHLVCVLLESFKPVSVPEVLRGQWKN